MYVSGLGFEVIGEFKDHDGFDRIIVGHPHQPYHLEFTHHSGVLVGSAPTKDNLLVFYIPVKEDWLDCCARMQIGWRLAYQHWGKGYATEAASTALRVGFEQLLVDEIVSFTTVGNLHSQAVMKRIGITRTETIEHPSLRKGSPLRQHCLYRLSGKQYTA